MFLLKNHTYMDNINTYNSTVASITDTSDYSGYNPKTRDTREWYNKVLSFLQERIGDFETSIIRGAAQEALLILKNENLRDPIKQSEVSKLVGKKVNDLEYHEILTYAKGITDFSMDDDDDDDMNRGDGATSTNDMGVAVVVEDEESEASDIDEVVDSEDEDEDDGGVEAKAEGKLGHTGDDDYYDENMEKDELYLSVHDIDAYWLQRKLSTYFSDANEAQRLAAQVLSLLQVTDERDCENKLVLLLEYDKFDFIKLLLKNRTKIAFCTRLKQG